MSLEEGAAGKIEEVSKEWVMVDSISASEDFLREVDRRLSIYGQSRHGNLDDLVEELLFIILSDQTEEYSFTKTWEALKNEFSDWDELREAPVERIAEVIKPGGLQNKKAKYIKATLEKIQVDFGELTLEPLKPFSDEEALQYLETLPGISAKNARCILMYSMRRQVFPVDTHVWRICRRLGLTPDVPKPTLNQQRQLEDLIPKDIRYNLHVDMVSHGRAICTTYWPKCRQCVLSDICPSSGKADDTWGEWRKPRGVWERYADKK